MNYFKRNFVSADQLLNTIAGGASDITISGRIGFFAHHFPNSKEKYWKAMERCVDITFYLMDGWGHCHQAYHKDKDENYELNAKQNPIGLFAFSLLTVPACIAIAAILYPVLGTAMLFGYKIPITEVIEHEN